ncbi:MAG: flagellar hook assembly protein FlgD [Succinivibrio sp.]|nr:flagellar hook assembly protein FlgD [Succinivibrio sp.]
MSNSSFDYSTIGKTSSYIAAENDAATKKSNSALSQEDFLKLLTTQLSNQDPSSPVDNNQMVTTMSQLSVVSSLADIQKGMSDITGSVSSSTALTASSLVGRSVLVDSSKAFFDGTNPVTAKIDAGSGANNLTINVLNSSGVVVGQYTANAGSGSMDFSWDGTDSEGKTLEPGMYTIVANAVKDGQAVSLPVSSYATVSSVTLGNTLSNTRLNLLGYGDISLSEVEEIAL